MQQVSFATRAAALQAQLRNAYNRLLSQINNVGPLSSAQVLPLRGMLATIDQLAHEAGIYIGMSRPAASDQRALNALAVFANDVIDAAETYVLALRMNGPGYVPPDPTSTSFVRTVWVPSWSWNYWMNPNGPPAIDVQYWNYLHHQSQAGGGGGGGGGGGAHQTQQQQQQQQQPPPNPPSQGGGGGGSPPKKPHHSQNNADPEDNSQTASSQDTPTSSGQPPSTPSTTPTTTVDPTTAPNGPTVTHPNPVTKTNVRPRQRQYVANTNVPLPNQPSGGPTIPFIPGIGEGGPPGVTGGGGIISMGGSLMGTPLPSLPSFPGINWGPTPGPGKGRGGGGGTTTTTTPSRTNGGGGGYAQQNNQDPPSDQGGGGHFGAGGDGGGPAPAPSAPSGDQPTAPSAPTPAADPPAPSGDTGGSGASGGTSTSDDTTHKSWRDTDPAQSGPDPETTSDDSNKKGRPGPDDPASGGEGPPVQKGFRFHPHSGGGARPNFPDPPSGTAGATGPFAGWTDSGGGGDWGGNPHENPDPEDSSSSSGSAAAVAANNSNPEASYGAVPSDTGYYEDDFWGGNNPHYMPYGGYSWTPYSNVGAATKLTKAALTTPSGLAKTVALHHK